MARGTTSRPRVADIVAEAGLSNDAFYRHFASKDALVAALVEDGAGATGRLRRRIRWPRKRRPRARCGLGRRSAVPDRAETAADHPRRAVERGQPRRRTRCPAGTSPTRRWRCCCVNRWPRWAAPHPRARRDLVRPRHRRQADRLPVAARATDRGGDRPHRVAFCLADRLDRRRSGMKAVRGTGGGVAVVDLDEPPGIGEEVCRSPRPASARPI